jgi:hypothetical protein
MSTVVSLQEFARTPLLNRYSEAMSRILFETALKQLVQEFDAEVDFLQSDLKGGRETEDVLIIAADVEDQSVPFPVPVEIPPHRFAKYFLRELGIGSDPVRLA